MPYFFAILLVSASYLTLSCDSHSSSQTAPNNPSVPIETEKGKEGSSTPDEGTSSGKDKVESDQSGLTGGARIEQTEMFRSLGAGIARRAQAFQESIEELEQAVTAFCVNPLTQDKEGVRQAWKKSMLIWQEFEVFQIGPLAADAKALKTSIYAWPLAPNLCRIDEETWKAAKEPNSPLPSNANRKGLQSVEHLLFEESLIASCPLSNVAKKEWDAWPLEKRWQGRCQYLKNLIAELRSQAQLLQFTWGTESHHYLSQSLGDPLAEKAALQSLYENLFYLDIEVKNYKLAAPAGHDSLFCPLSPAPCPGKEEFPLSQISREAIQANIMALTDLIFGFPDSNKLRPGGFAAFIRSRGDEILALRSEALTRELTQYLADESVSLKDHIERQKQENCELSQSSTLCKLRKSIKQISADFKYEYSQLLNLNIPSGPQGDND